MGWSGGPDLANNVWSVVRQYIPEDRRKKVAKEIIELFNQEDADDWGSHESELLMKDAEE